MHDHLTIATRGSALARWQTEHVAALLRAAHPELPVEILVLQTRGDQVLDVALSKIGDKGLFTQELEAALLDGRADIAVHSLKDLPTQLPDGLVLAATTQREDPRDVLLFRRDALASGSLGDKTNQPLSTLLKLGAVIGTSSLRRRALLAHQCPAAIARDVRGNVDTRIGKLRSGQYDGILLACAGLRRLGFLTSELGNELREDLADDLVALPLSVDTWLPAVSQGILGIEGRTGDERVHTLLAPLECPLARGAATLERQVLRAMEGGCQVPLAAHALVLEDGRYRLRACVSSIDGQQVVNADAKVRAAAEGAAQVIQALEAGGAREILKAVRDAHDTATE